MSEYVKLQTDPTLQEPSGWVRSVPDMRRRPNGDPAREYKQGDENDPYRQNPKPHSTECTSETGDLDKCQT